MLSITYKYIYHDKLTLHYRRDLSDLLGDWIFRLFSRRYHSRSISYRYHRVDIRCYPQGVTEKNKSRAGDISPACFKETFRKTTTDQFL